jgi:outer membrane receptor protein involved in Fe transport
MYGSTTLEGVAGGSVATDRLYYGLRVEGDGQGGYQCADPVARAIGCIPVNPFQPYTQEMKDYLLVQTGHRGRSVLKDGIAYLAGDVMDLPAGPLQIAVGAEVRELSGNVDYDDAINRGTTTGNQITDTERAIVKTEEAYIEAIVPLLSGMTGVEHLEIETAYRYSDTENIDTYDTWKYGLNWSPIQGLRLRAMRARSVRAPVAEDLSGIGQTFGTVTDPCIGNANRASNPVLNANCLADGVPANYAPSQNILQNVTGFVGGNPDVKPEVGTTNTFGVTYVPDFLPGFDITVDRFQIEVEGIITEVDRALKAELCYNSTPRQYCEDITRGTHPDIPGATYVLKSIDSLFENVAKFDISGYDIQARYALPLGGAGDLSFDFVATIYDKADFTPIAGEATVDLLGAAGGSTDLQGFLRRQGRLDIGYRIANFGVLWNMRHIGRADMSVAAREEGFPEVGSHTYHNTRFSYRFEGLAGLERTEFYAGVNNVFDKEPPFFATSTSGTQALDTIPAYYDVFGRSYYAGFTARF